MRSKIFRRWASQLAFAVGILMVAMLPGRPELWKFWDRNRIENAVEMPGWWDDGPMPRQFENGPIARWVIDGHTVERGPLPTDVALSSYQDAFVRQNTVARDRRYAPFTALVPMQYKVYQEVYADEPRPPLLPGQRGYIIYNAAPMFRRPGGPEANRPRATILNGSGLFGDGSPTMRGLLR